MTDAAERSISDALIEKEMMVVPASGTDIIAAVIADAKTLAEAKEDIAAALEVAEKFYEGFCERSHALFMRRDLTDADFAALKAADIPRRDGWKAQINLFRGLLASLRRFSAIATCATGAPRIPE